MWSHPFSGVNNLDLGKWQPLWYLGCVHTPTDQLPFLHITAWPSLSYFPPARMQLTASLQPAWPLVMLVRRLPGHTLLSAYFWGCSPYKWDLQALHLSIMRRADSYTVQTFIKIGGFNTELSWERMSLGFTRLSMPSSIDCNSGS